MFIIVDVLKLDLTAVALEKSLAKVVDKVTIWSLSRRVVSPAVWAGVLFLGPCFDARLTIQFIAVSTLPHIERNDSHADGAAEKLIKRLLDRLLRLKWLFALW